jgi:hypothetical protein
LSCGGARRRWHTGACACQWRGSACVSGASVRVQQQQCTCSSSSSGGSRHAHAHTHTHTHGVPQHGDRPHRTRVAAAACARGRQCCVWCCASTAASSPAGAALCAAPCRVCGRRARRRHHSGSILLHTATVTSLGRAAATWCNDGGWYT